MTLDTAGPSLPTELRAQRNSKLRSGEPCGEGMLLFNGVLRPSRPRQSLSLRNHPLFRCQGAKNPAEPGKKDPTLRPSSPSSVAGYNPRDLRRSLADRALAPEGQAHGAQESPRLFVGLRSRDDNDIHAANLIDLIVDNLREDQLFAEPHREVASSIERVRVHTLEVAHTGQGNVEEPVQKLIHDRAAQRDLGAD